MSVTGISAGRADDNLNPNPTVQTTSSWPTYQLERATPTRRELVEPLIAKWRERLGLTEWDIRYSDEQPDRGLARSDIFRDKLVVVVTINESLPDVALERSVIHELLHIVLLFVGDAWLDRADGFLPPPLFESLSAMSTQAEERAIERLIRAFTEVRYIAPTDRDDIFSRTFKE